MNNSVDENNDININQEEEYNNNNDKDEISNNIKYFLINIIHSYDNYSYMPYYIESIKKNNNKINLNLLANIFLNCRPLYYYLLYNFALFNN